MNFLRNRHRDRLRSSFRPIWWLLLILVLVVFGGALIRGRTSGTALSLARPFWQIRQGGANVWQSFHSLLANKNNLTRENVNLKAKLVLLEARVATKEQLSSENESLRQLLGRFPGANNSQVARTLLGWPSGPFDILFLDLGRENSRSPIKVGDRVLVADDIWLGQLTEVYGQTSKVRLLTFAGQETPAFLAVGRAPLVLHGRGGGNFIATLPRGVAVTPGDKVMVSGVDHDWLVAVVGAVEVNPSQTEETLYLQAPVNARNLNYVIIEPS